MSARAPRRPRRAPEAAGPARSVAAPVVPAHPPAAFSVGNRPGRRETSAGGLVVRRIDGAPAVALIGRLDRAGRLRWSLPKGHVEPGETTEQAAIREVAEETGITGRITGSLGSVSYTFTVAGRRIHKKVHHYLMVAVTGELSDEDAEVTEVAWVPLQRAPGVLAYSAERRIAHRAADILADTA